MSNPYETDLDKNAANYTPLSPLTFIKRTAAVYPQRAAVVHGTLTRSWSEMYARCRQLASALSRRGIGVGDCVAVMAPNIPEVLEAHFGIPMTGGVINALNVRLDAATLAGALAAQLGDTLLPQLLTMHTLLSREPTLVMAPWALAIR